MFDDLEQGDRGECCRHFLKFQRNFLVVVYHGVLSDIVFFTICQNNVGENQEVMPPLTFNSGKPNNLITANIMKLLISFFRGVNIKMSTRKIMF